MALTTEERLVWEQRLVEAEAAYHDLQTGGGVRVLVDQNGERIEFTPASLLRLSGYIASIRSKLGKTGGVSGPLRFLGR